MPEGHQSWNRSDVESVSTSNPFVKSNTMNECCRAALLPGDKAITPCWGSTQRGAHTASRMMGPSLRLILKGRLRLTQCSKHHSSCQPPAKLTELWQPLIRFARPNHWTIFIPASQPLLCPASQPLLEARRIASYVIQSSHRLHLPVLCAMTAQQSQGSSTHPTSSSLLAGASC